MEQELVRLLSHSSLECANAGLVFQDRLDAGYVYVLPNNPNDITKNRFGASGQYTGGGFNGVTILYEKAFNESEVGATIAHEVFGHQYLSNYDEAIAEHYAQVCGGTA